MYLGAKIEIVGQDDFVRITPVTAWKPKVQATVRVVPQPGIAYINPQGQLFLSLSETDPPEGFQVLGQASIHPKTLQRWKKQSTPVKVENAGGLRA